MEIQKFLNITVQLIVNGAAGLIFSSVKTKIKNPDKSPEIYGIFKKIRIGRKLNEIEQEC